ncbi:hypothetical protein ACIBF7_03010 [Nonomuraea sp. NPDC050478]|uniref:hypothetical protein n=1 Tax=Nonomuraea sp. NPDC050478 TaxID=3364365 RepID=UPI003798CEB1
MAETIWLSSDRPHDDDYAIETARALSEAVRLLNHASLSHAGITYPSTVHQVLGHIGDTAARLDQLLTQLGDALGRMQASRQLVDDHGDPSERLDKALSELASARKAASDLAYRTHRAFNTSASLHLKAGGEH